MICAACGGDGLTDAICHNCNGSGINVLDGDCHKCRHCEGTGHQHCLYCRGSGWIEDDESRLRRDETGGE